MSAPVHPQSFASATRPSPARFAADDAAFAADVEEIERASGGHLCFAALDLQSGAILRRHADRPCKTASVIKLPILVHVALAVREAALSWDESLTLTDAEKVDGSGMLTHLTAGLKLTLRDICTLMTIISDNTGTNMVIERVGIDAINSRMRALGLPVTTCFRKAYSPDTEASRLYGLGVTTPDEMLRMVELLARGGIGDEGTSRDVLKIMEAQHYRDCIPRLLPQDWTYAGKTGAVNAVRNDVGLVTTPDGRQFALSLFCQDLDFVQWTADNPAVVALARLARRILQ